MLTNSRGNAKRTKITQGGALPYPLFTKTHTIIFRNALFHTFGHFEMHKGRKKKHTGWRTPLPINHKDAHHYFLEMHSFTPLAILKCIRSFSFVRYT